MKEKKGLKRIFQYGIRYAEQSFSLLIIMLVVYALTQFLQRGVSIDIYFEIIPFFIIVSLILMLIQQMINEKGYITTTISFGITRRLVFTGLQWINAVLAVQNTCVFILLMLPANDMRLPKPEFVLGYLALTAAFGGLGQIIEAICVRYGKTGGIISGIILLVLLISSTLAFVLYQLSKGSFELSFSFENMGSKIGIAIAAAIVLYGAGAYFCRRAILKYEVRA